MKWIRQFENHPEGDIKTSIKNLKKIPIEYKEVSYDLVKQYTKAENGVITGLNLHPDLISKIRNNNLPSGFDMGIDKNGFFIHTHRARSKSVQSPDKITHKQIKFIDSTG